MVRLVHNVALAGMTSPIKHVMWYLHDALVNIAPEQKEAFDREFEDFAITYLDDHHWVCEVDVAARHIRLSRKVPEVMWAASLAYYKLYTELQARLGGRSMSAPLELKPNQMPALGPSMSLLHWALDSWLNKLDLEWPAGLPRPTEDEQSQIDEKVATELCLGATAFLVHHELAHIRLRHGGGDQLDQERDADFAAADWALAGLADETDVRFVKRALAVALALELVVAYGIHAGKHGDEEHPRSFDRLMHTLDRHVRDENHSVWYFLVATLKLHLDNVSHRAAISNGPYDTARECVDAFVDALSRVA